MFETVCAKTWMVKHIRDLFRGRADDLHRATWTCVVRDGKVTVMRRFMTETQDREIIRRLLRPRQLPSWFQTNWAVRKHWSALRPIAMEGWRKSCTDRERPPLQELHYGT